MKFSADNALWSRNLLVQSKSKNITEQQKSNECLANLTSSSHPRCPYLPFSPPNIHIQAHSPTPNPQETNRNSLPILYHTKKLAIHHASFNTQLTILPVPSIFNKLPAEQILLLKDKISNKLSNSSIFAQNIDSTAYKPIQQNQKHLPIPSPSTSALHEMAGSNLSAAATHWMCRSINRKDILHRACL